MFISADTMALLLESGLPGDKLAEIVRALDRDHQAIQGARTTSAERQARYRARKAEKAACDATRDVTRDACGDVDPLPLSPSPQTPQPHTPTPGEGSIARTRGGPTNLEVARGFAAFWAAYPKRVGKDAAAKSFAKALARIADADPLAVILAGIERALPGWDDPQFIPHPATWLNAGRWEDDAPPQPKPAPLRTLHDRPDRSAKHTATLENYQHSGAGAELAAAVVAARRNL